MTIITNINTVARIHKNKSCLSAMSPLAEAEYDVDDETPWIHFEYFWKKERSFGIKDGFEYISGH